MFRLFPASDSELNKDFRYSPFTVGVSSAAPPCNQLENVADSSYRTLEIVRAQFSPCAFVNLVLRYFVFVPAIVEESIITSNRSDTQRFDVCKMFVWMNTSYLLGQE